MEELAGLPADARKLALDRFRLLQPHLEQDQPLKAVALAAGIPYQTAHRWLAQYPLFGLVALARKTRGDRGERIKWFQGGKINVTVNCLDLHLKSARKDKVALIWEGEPGIAGNIPMLSSTRKFASLPTS